MSLHLVQITYGSTRARVVRALSRQHADSIVAGLQGDSDVTAVEVTDTDTGAVVHRWPAPSVPRSDVPDPAEVL